MARKIKGIVNIISTVLLGVTLVLTMTAPAAAGTEKEVQGIDVGVAVENLPPEIDEGSLLVQIIDGADVAWEWKAGAVSGERPVPYIFEGEELHIGVDVSDPNGSADLTSMIVTAMLVPGMEFPCVPISTTIDSEGEISKAHYSANVIMSDASLAQGKYDLQITVTDPVGNSDSFNPNIYQDPEDMLVNPAVCIKLTESVISFASIQPGKLNIPAEQNPIGLLPEAMIGDEHIPVRFALGHSGADLENIPGGDSIPISSVTWALHDGAGGDTPMSGDSQTIDDYVEEGDTVEVYYWLNAPFPLASGAYTGKISYHIKVK